MINIINISTIWNKTFDEHSIVICMYWMLCNLQDVHTLFVGQGRWLTFPCLSLLPIYFGGKERLTTATISTSLSIIGRQSGLGQMCRPWKVHAFFISWIAQPAFLYQSWATCKEVALPTVSWPLQHQPQIKKLSYRLAYRTIPWRDFLIYILCSLYHINTEISWHNHVSQNGYSFLSLSNTAPAFSKSCNCKHVLLAQHPLAIFMFYLTSFELPKNPKDTINIYCVKMFQTSLHEQFQVEFVWSYLQWLYRGVDVFLKSV